MLEGGRSWLSERRAKRKKLGAGPWYHAEAAVHTRVVWGAMRMCVSRAIPPPWVYAGHARLGSGTGPLGGIAAPYGGQGSGMLPIELLVGSRRKLRACSSATPSSWRRCRRIGRFVPLLWTQD